MKELSLNVLDIAQNSLVAGAKLTTIETIEQGDKLTITITDDGKGMNEEQVKSVTDPFFTTRTTRDVGLGIPLFKMAAEMTGGSLDISSKLGEGTRISAVFDTSSIDCVPIGDMEDTISALIQMNPDLDFVYKRAIDDKEFTLDTRSLREMLEGVPLDTPDITVWIRQFLDENLKDLKG